MADEVQDPGLTEAILPVVEDAPAAPDAVVAPDPAPEPAAPACPVCGGPLAVYAGTNPLKFGTGWCETDGRQPLEG